MAKPQGPTQVAKKVDPSTILVSYKFKDDPEHALSLERPCTTSCLVKVTEDGNLVATSKEEVIDVEDVFIFCHTCGSLSGLDALKDHGIAEYWEEVG